MTICTSFNHVNVWNHPIPPSKIHFQTSPFHTLQYKSALPISLYCCALCQYSSYNSCFLVEADIAISTLTNIIIVTLVRATNNYKVAAETIFLSVVPLTQSVKGCCNLHFTWDWFYFELIGWMTHSGVTIIEANNQWIYHAEWT